MRGSQQQSIARINPEWHLDSTYAGHAMKFCRRIFIVYLRNRRLHESESMGLKRSRSMPDGITRTFLPWAALFKARTKCRATTIIPSAAFAALLEQYTPYREMIFRVQPERFSPNKSEPRNVTTTGRK